MAFPGAWVSVGALLKQRGHVDRNPGVAVPPPTVNPVNLGDGSQASIDGDLWTAQSPGQAWSLAVDPDPSPTYSIHEVRAGDRWGNDVINFPSDGRQRCELRNTTKMPLGTPLWVAGGLRITTAGFNPAADAYNTVLQLHQDAEAGESGKSAALALTIFDGVMQINTRGDANAVTTSPPPITTRYEFDFAPYLGQWVHFVLMGVFDWANGHLQAWVDSSPKVDARGIVMGYNDTAGPYTKCGLYREAWTDTAVIEWANLESGTTDLSARITDPLPVPA